MVDEVPSTGSEARGARSHRIATPWILGLYALASATFIMATRWADWYSGSGSEGPFLLLPLAAVLGGIALLAGMWAFEAGDGLATAMLGIWGAFWIAYGLLDGLFLSGRLAEPNGMFPEIGFWFIVVGGITWMGAVAALAESLALVLTLGFLAAGSTLAAIANIADHGGLELVAGWLFIIAAVIGWYTATGMMFERTAGRSVLPLGECAHTEPYSPVRRAADQGKMTEMPAGQRIG